jgi:hypothetical protein
MVSPGNFAPVSVVGTSNLGTSQTPVEQPEDTQPRYSETPTPFYLNAARNKSPGKSPAEWASSISASGGRSSSSSGSGGGGGGGGGGGSGSGVTFAKSTAGQQFQASNFQQSWPGPDPTTSPVAPGSAGGMGIHASELVGMSPLQSIAHVSSAMNTAADMSPAVAQMGSPEAAAKAALSAAAASGIGANRSPMPNRDADGFAQPEAPR